MSRKRHKPTKKESFERRLWGFLDNTISKIKTVLFWIMLLSIPLVWLGAILLVMIYFGQGPGFVLFWGSIFLLFLALCLYQRYG